MFRVREGIRVSGRSSGNVGALITRIGFWGSFNGFL